jgi:hypothetical protein
MTRPKPFKVAIFIVALVLVGAAAVVIVVHRSEDQPAHVATKATSATAPPATTVAATTKPTPSTTVPATTTTPVLASPGSAIYQGARFWIDYPPGWVVSHLPEGGGDVDTTFQPPGEWSGWLMRVDLDPHFHGTAAASAGPVIAALAGNGTYQLVGVTSISFEKQAAVKWEFEDTDGGIRVHKVDTFFVDASGGWAVLVQAPQSAWAQGNAGLETYQETFDLQAVTSTTVQPASP